MSAVAAFTPLAGSVCARAIEYLDVVARGRWTPTAVLADTLDFDARGIYPTLQMALRAGAVERCRIDGLWNWRRGSGVVMQPDGSEVDEDPIVQRVVHVPGPTISDTPPQESKAAQLSASPAVGKDHAEQRSNPQSPKADVLGGVDIDIAHRRPAAARTPLRIALWSDGQLVIERGAVRIAFPADETRQIVRYLERIAESEL